ncbi:MAG TPA: amidohydrolase family protein [Acidimicrobiales bacterium]|nr:amidohydrolase family protein [Acidimicrobiales bacterium]
MSTTEGVDGQGAAGPGGTDRALVISSDGHAMAKMPDYTPYIPNGYQEEFESFLAVYRQYGSDLGSSDPDLMALKLEPEYALGWRDNIVAGRLEGLSDPARRLPLMEEQGVAAEVLFPDFGLPFQMQMRAMLAAGITSSPEQRAAGYRAHNRWLADFCSVAPGRFAGMACLSFHDVDAAVQEIHWAKEAGLKGIVLPAFDEDSPLYLDRFDPIWRTLVELELPANTHAATSMTTSRQLHVGTEPHVSCGFTMYQQELFFVSRQILHHFIWGGVLERHPELKVVMTEQGSGWVVGVLEAMDYTYEGSYLPRDLRRVIKHKPSEYFQRQMFLGSSIFSRAEVEIRDQIGLDKMMLGMDYPHIEGTWGVGPGTPAYLQATLGAAGVPRAEAELLLSRNAVDVFGFDPVALDPVRRRIGPEMAEILTPPTEDHYPRGDVHKPIGAPVA